MHASLLLCQLLLHWEFLPFLPVRYSQPQGPVDLTETQAKACYAPSGFWRSSARECFTAAHSILRLCKMWREAGALPLTPFIAYATHTAAFISLYGASFPWMCSHVSNPLLSMMHFNAEDILNPDLKAEHTKRLDSSGFQDMRVSVRLMEGWAETLASVGEYFCRFKTDFQQAERQGDWATATQQFFSLRDGGFGTGLSEYSLFERALRDFGCTGTH